MYKKKPKMLSLNDLFCVLLFRFFFFFPEKKKKAANQQRGMLMC